MGFPQNYRRDQGPALRHAVRLVQILRGVRTIFLGLLTEGAVERMRDWESLTFNTPSVGYADTSLTREARVLCGFGGEFVGVGVLDDPCRIFSPSVTCGDTSLVRGRQRGSRNLAMIS